MAVIIVNCSEFTRSHSLINSNQLITVAMHTATATATTAAHRFTLALNVARCWGFLDDTSKCAID